METNNRILVGEEEILEQEEYYEGMEVWYSNPDKGEPTDGEKENFISYVRNIESFIGF